MADYTAEPQPGEKTSEAVVAAVAAATGQSPLELEPLAGAVDPDALNRLLQRDTEGLTVVFEYSGRRVTVTPGEIRVAR